MAHLALVFEDGSVYDFSLEEQVSPSKGQIIKLPKKRQYHGYSDENGTLYFIDSELKSPVIKYHKSINEQGHRTIPNTADHLEKLGLVGPKPITFTSSISIGDYFWLLASSEYDIIDINHPPIWAMNNFSIHYATAIWYKKKEKLGRGPDLPDFLGRDVFEFGTFCSLSLNSTHLMFFGFFKQGEHPDYKRVSIFDFYKKTQMDLTSLDLGINEKFVSCQASLVFDKNGKAKVWLAVEKFRSLNDNKWLELLSHELSPGGCWKIQSSYVIEDNSYERSLSINPKSYHICW